MDLKFKKAALAAAMMSFLTAGLAWAASDTWITTKAKLKLLTSDVSITGVSVDTKDGVVTLHGKVRTHGAKERAERVVEKLDGVKDVENLIQVVPEYKEVRVEVQDDRIKDDAKASLKDAGLDDQVKIKSVNNGVVLLSGKTDNLGRQLEAVEVVWNVPGVKRVSAEITSPED